MALIVPNYQDPRPGDFYVVLFGLWPVSSFKYTTQKGTTKESPGQGFSCLDLGTLKLSIESGPRTATVRG